MYILILKFNVYDFIELDQTMESVLKHQGSPSLSSILLPTSILPKYNSRFQRCKLYITAHFYELINVISMYFITGTTDVSVFSESL